MSRVSHRHRIRAGVAGSTLAGALLLSSCVPESSIKPVDTIASVSAAETVLVGKVELHPPLAPGEQNLGDSYKEFERSAMLIIGDRLRPVPRLAMGDMSQRIDAPFDKLYFVRYPAKPLYILKGWVVMNAKIEVVGPNDTRPDRTAAPLQGAFSVDVRPGDKAVYVGTIQYFRDEFFSTEKVVVKDEFAAANTEFQRRFGNGTVLRKSLALPVLAKESK